MYLYLFKMKYDLDKFCDIYLHVFVFLSFYTLSCNAFMVFFCPFRAFLLYLKQLCSTEIKTAFGFGAI